MEEKIIHLFNECLCAQHILIDHLLVIYNCYLYKARDLKNLSF